MTPQEAADNILLVLYAADMHASNMESIAPAADIRLSPAWRVVGYITGDDCLFRRGQSVAYGQTVYYGYLAQSIADPTSYAVAVRGTDGIVEWVEDAEFFPVSHPVAGTVEVGFYRLYMSMQYTPIGGIPVPSAKGIAAAVNGGSVKVIGHSLGSALATYLTFDLATEIGTRVSGAFFASPQTGNETFVKAFDGAVHTYDVFNYCLDVVPHVPLGPDYETLPRATWLGIEEIEAKIKFDLACHHHAICYASMLDYAIMDWQKVSTIDQPCVACIRGPRQ